MSTSPSPRHGPADDGALRSADGTDEFLAVRRRLLTVARSVLGHRSDAEDVVQEAWLRWQACDRTAVECPTAFLVTTTRRLAINASQTAWSRHEATVGTPHDDAVPVGSVAGDEPSTPTERRAALEAGCRLLFERLSPSERAAYVLRKGFDYPYAQLAGLLGLTEANVRQLVSRAQRHLAVPHHRAFDPAAHRRLVDGIMAAARGDLGELEASLRAPVVGHAPRQRGQRHPSARSTTASRPLSVPACHNRDGSMVTSHRRARSLPDTTIGALR